MYTVIFKAFKKQFICILFLAGCMSSFSQNTAQKSDFWNKVRFGGGIGLGFTNGSFNGSVSPSAIYQFNNQFSAGTSLNFNYAKFRNDRLLAYGGSVLSLYNPIPFIQLSAEFEQLRVNRSFDNGTIALDRNYWSPAFFLGAGYTDRNFTVGIRYDLLFDEVDSIYANAWLPFVRVYF